MYIKELYNTLQFSDLYLNNIDFNSKKYDNLTLYFIDCFNELNEKLNDLELSDLDIKYSISICEKQFENDIYNLFYNYINENGIYTNFEVKNIIDFYIILGRLQLLNNNQFNTFVKKDNFDNYYLTFYSIKQIIRLINY